MAVMYCICGWCKAPLEPPTITVPDNDPMAGETTHGICLACRIKNFPTVQDHRDLADQAEELLKQ